MSDPVTNMQIEDVLSSIRKLVSEEVRAQTRPTKVADPQRKAEKLILTPAHRVPEAEDNDAESDYAGPEAASEFDMDAFSRELQADAPDHAPETVEDVAEAPEEPLFRHGRSRRTIPGQSLSALAADAGFEDEGANAGTPLDMSVFAEDPVEEAELGEADDHDDLIADADGSDDAPEARMATIPSFLRSRGVRSMNTRLAAVPPEPEPDALSWEDHLAAGPATAGDLPAASEIEGDVWAEAGSDEDDAGQGLVLDEEALRDMVSEIVRQELQGALGERITRNVRKLVRREIQRALTAHDLL